MTSAGQFGYANKKYLRVPSVPADIRVRLARPPREETMTEENRRKTEYALSLIASGDSRGVDELYLCMGRVMMFIARSVTGDNFTAEEVVQDSLLKVVRGISGYKKGTNAYAWVCRVVKNTALSAAEKIRPDASLEDFHALSDGGGEEEKSAARLTVEKLISSLYPPELGRMIFMKYFMDMTVREIAAELGKSKSYVAKQIVKAEQQMRGMLKD